MSGWIVAWLVFLTLWCLLSHVNIQILWGKIRDGRDHR